MAARPAAPTRGPTQRSPARHTPPAIHTCQYPPYPCFDTPTYRKRNLPSWTPLVPIRQTAPTTRTPFVHPSTAQSPSNPVVVRSVPRHITYTKLDTPHSRERVSLRQPESSTAANPTHTLLETVRQNLNPPRSPAPRTARPEAAGGPTQSIPKQGVGGSYQKLRLTVKCARTNFRKKGGTSPYNPYSH